MTAIELIKITYNPPQDAIDFGIPVSADSILVKRAPDVIKMLRRLADCLERREYPFANMDNDPERTRQLLLNVVKEYRKENPAPGEERG